MEVPKATRNRARALRRRMSLPEVLLWNKLRRGAVEGLRFRKQHPIGTYVLDFYCDEARLAVEVDGEIHAFYDRPERDAVRDAWLEGQGILSVRLPASVVLKDMTSAVDTILWHAEQRRYRNR